MIINNTNYLKKTYNSFFNGDVSLSYLEYLSNEINEQFSKDEIAWFKKCLNANLDINAIEYGIRHNKKNIFSFILLRLSTLAETQPNNQKIFVNYRSKNIFGILMFFLKIMIDLIGLKIKLIKYNNIIKEYPNV